MSVNCQFDGALTLAFLLLRDAAGSAMLIGEMQELQQEEQKVLQRNGVAVVILFGSQMTGQTGEGSDRDVGLVFQDERARLRDPVAVYGELYDLFQHRFPHERLDLVYLREAGYAFQYRVVMDGDVFYAASPLAYADYREAVMRRYFDFAPVEDACDAVFVGKGGRHDAAGSA